MLIFGASQLSVPQPSPSVGYGFAAEWFRIRLRRGPVSLLRKPVARSLFHIDYLIESSEKADPFIFLFQRRVR
jgi:hypothetical protein